MRLPALRAAALAAFVMSVAAIAQSPPPAAVDLLRVEPIVGSWSYQPVAGGSVATFLDSGGHARMLVRCTRASRVVTLTRTAVPAAVQTMLVTTSFGVRSLPASFDTARSLSASLAATDPFLDDIAFSRGKIALSNAGSSALVVPAWADIVRVIEDCRN